MKKTTKLFSFLLLFAIACCSKESEVKSDVNPSEIKVETNIPQEVTDPDLSLSIDELKAKYPIDWLEKKYGDWEKFCENYGYCECNSTPKECEKFCKIPPKPDNLSCRFFADEKELNQFLQLDSNRDIRKFFLDSYYDETTKRNIKSNTTQILDKLSAKFLNVFNDLDEAQIKSVIINYEDDSRSKDVINIMLSQIKDQNFSHKNKEKIKKFFYSKTIAESIFLSCDNTKNLDYENEFYDSFVMTTLQKSFDYWKKYEVIESRIRTCIIESKQSYFKEKFTKSHQLK